MCIKKVFLLVCILLVTFHIKSQDNPGFRIEDKARLKEAFDICSGYGELLWKDWSKIPYTALFVTDDNEYLINHPAPASDRAAAGRRLDIE